jgi:phosphatidylethanolamine-binding protein (PEBP) family uncharacterized protein
MLEHIPHWLGAALGQVRAGSDKLALATTDLYGAVPIILSSTAFADGGRLPDRFTADGAGVSPPLAWGKLPAGTHSLLLLVEDPDAPLPQPAVHAIVAGIDPAVASLAEGAILPDGDGGASGDTGRNSYGREGWLPPDPPPVTASTTTSFSCSRWAMRPRSTRAPTAATSATRSRAECSGSGRSPALSRAARKPRSAPSARRSPPSASP